MIEKNWPEDGYVAHCDECSNDLEINKTLWSEVLRELHHHGWSYQRDEKGEWRHYCPDHRGAV